MINHYFISIYNLFIIFPLIFMFVLVFGIIAVFSLIFFNIFLYLDSFYRPNNKQIPYNLLLDRVLPIVAIVSPSIIILNINSSNLSLLEKFSYMILMHVFLLMPIMYYWSKLRNWFDDSQHMITWSHPKLFFNLSIGMIYPMVWGVYFVCLRYIRLSQDLVFQDIIDFFVYPEHMAYFFVFFCSFINVVWYFFILFGFINNIRKYLWHITNSLVYSIHLKLLSYNFYFYFMEKIFKSFFIYKSAISLRSS